MSPTMQKFFGVVLAFLAVATLSTGIYSIRNQQRLARCQADYNEKFINQLHERTVIANQDRESLATMVKGLLKEGGTREDRAALLGDYLKAKEKNDAERAKYPLPELPAKASCG
ncbi:hypothetical protein AB0F25_30570 [Streptomyces wedmorensis]|uniref:hypothetical protein n=1 Tax=Streptomyces wedmorensis TaxID=43759 RepID=UPI00341C218D